jgi:hypothetical protein
MMRHLWQTSLLLFIAITMASICAIADPIIKEAEEGVITAPLSVVDGYVVSSIRTTNPLVSGKASISFNILESDNYAIQLLVDSPIGFDYFASVDAQTPSRSYFVNPGQETRGFEWRTLYWSVTEGSDILKLSPGLHTVTLYGGTANVKVDKVRIIKITDLLLSQVAPATGFVDGNVAVMAGGLGIGAQVRNGCYLSGAYFACFIRTNLDKFDAVVTLPKKLEPKKYYVYVKGIAPAGVQVRIGSAISAKVLTNSRDHDGDWNVLGPLDVMESTEAVVITTFRGSTPLTARELTQIGGIYITDDPQDRITATDVIVPVTSPSPEDMTPPVKGNLISNSSFEVGVLSDWIVSDRYDLTSLGAKYLPFSSVWDRTVGYDGSASMIVSPNRVAATGMYTYQVVYSRAYHLKPNKRYTASAMMKLPAGQTARVVFRLVNSWDDTIKSETVVTNLNNNWQRVSVSTVTHNASDYRVEFLVHNTTAPLWADAFQLEEGPLAPYESSASVESGFEFNTPGNIFYEDGEAITGKLHLKNTSPYSSAPKINIEVRDYLNTVVKKESLTPPLTSLSAGQLKSLTVNVSTGRRGPFRLTYWIDGVNGSEKEVTYSILPRPTIIGTRQNSVMGIHANIGDLQFAVANKMGINWFRTLSTADLFRWSIVEPTDDDFIWHDNAMIAMASHSINIMGSLNLGQLPVWAIDENKLPRLDKWQDYVSRVVSHYKTWVTHWEIGNELHYTIPAEHYARMLKTAVDAIELADPNANIVGMGGTDYKFMHAVIASLAIQYPGWDLKAHVKAVSTHAYPSGVGVPSARDAIIATYGIPVWNTEAGVWDRGFSAGDFSGFTAYGRQIFQYKDAERYYRAAIKKPEAIVQNFLSSLGGGQSKYFYYDSRVSDSPLSSQPTIIETDDSVRPKGIAYAIAGYFVDYASPLGVIPLTNTHAYLFEKEGSPLLTLWSTDFKNRSLRTSLNSSQFKLYDIMGNEVPSSAGVLPIGRTPLYVKGVGIATEAFKAAVVAGVLSDRSDTVAPRLMLASAPRGPIPEGTLRLRWFALDETSLPEIGDLDPEQTEPTPGSNPSALMYSYRLTGKDAEWSLWTPETFINYKNLPAKSYLFEVKAKDEAGNESAIESRTIVIGTQNMNAPLPPAGVRVVYN